MNAPPNLAVYQDFVRALAQRGFETLSIVEESPTKVRLMGRVKESDMDTWKSIVRELHFTGKESGAWSVDGSKKLFPRDENSRRSPMVAAWRLLVSAKPSTVAHCTAMTRAVLSVSRVSGGPLTVPIPGEGANRNSVAGGRRGAQPVLTAVVGPMAIQRTRAGG